MFVALRPTSLFLRFSRDLELPLTVSTIATQVMVQDNVRQYKRCDLPTKMHQSS